jgi:hypothetical protein
VRLAEQGNDDPEIVKEGSFVRQYALGLFSLIAAGCMLNFGPGSGGAGGQDAQSASSSTTTGAGCGGAGGAGSSGTISIDVGVPCDWHTDCPHFGELPGCQQYACENHFCKLENVAKGTSAGIYTIGGCTELVCDGQGNLVTVVDFSKYDLECYNFSLNDGRSEQFFGVCDGNGDCVECLYGHDCESKHCRNNICIPASCDDEILNGNETDIDCGGGINSPCDFFTPLPLPGVTPLPVCARCATGKTCINGGDCVSGVCSGGKCAPGSPICNIPR